MCDYSLESAARRDAAVGDQLKTARIGVHGTIGLVSRHDPETAVCLLPGARLVVSGIPAGLQQQWGVGEAAIATSQSAIAPAPIRDRWGSTMTVSPLMAPPTGWCCSRIFHWKSKFPWRRFPASQMTFPPPPNLNSR
ncbi:MAG TPA: hypothetical protein VN718_01090 [Rhizomicrobium sp.]|nr:hypothetical protein [Rhizomicrobium sp.]